LILLPSYSITKFQITQLPIPPCGTGILACALLVCFAMFASAQCVPFWENNRQKFSVSEDNSAITTYKFHSTNPTHTSTLGQYNPAYIGVQFTGAVAPSNFVADSPSSFVLKRSILKARIYEDGSNASTLVDCVNDSSLSVTCSPSAVGADTGDGSFQDRDPQSSGSGGKIYDLDGPGPAEPLDGNTRRMRVNFVEWVEYRAIKASSDFAWFSRSSRAKASGLSSYNNTVAADNQAGSGSTALTWNLQ
jgi:hypothetical protein